MKTKNLLDRLIYLRPPRPPQPVKPGLYHYMREADGAFTRFHLRVEPDGSGTLLANATTAARLSPSGVVIAKELLDGKNESAILKDLVARFRGASEEMMQRDLGRVQDVIGGLVAPGDNYPILNLTDAAFLPHEAELMAPLQADVPLAPPEQLVPVIDRLWEVGIPHVTFLAPEGAEAAHLVQAVERAEDLGMIAGVRGRAGDLTQGSLLGDLALAGVDHITVPYASAKAEIHDALFGHHDHDVARRLFGQILQQEVCPVAEIPLLETTVDGLFESLQALLAAGVTNFSVFAVAVPDDSESDGALAAGALRQVATLVEEAADELQVRCLWQPPVRRNLALSLAEQVRRGPRCSGDVAVRVEPEGSVIPPRGLYRSAGNLLQDSWEAIWEDSAFLAYRQRVEAPTHCDVCPGLAICAADCPARPEGWADMNYEGRITKDELRRTKE